MFVTKVQRLHVVCIQHATVKPVTFRVILMEVQSMSCTFPIDPHNYVSLSKVHHVLVIKTLQSYMFLTCRQSTLWSDLMVSRWHWCRAFPSYCWCTCLSFYAKRLQVVMWKNAPNLVYFDLIRKGVSFYLYNNRSNLAYSCLTGASLGRFKTINLSV